MQIGTKERIVTITALAVIGLIAALIWRTFQEVDAANRQLQQASEISRGLSQLRLVTFEYHLYHNERAKVQWHAVANRVDRAVAAGHTSIPAQDQILTSVREGMAKVRVLFTELTSSDPGSRAEGQLDETTRLFEAQLFSRVLAEQQNSIIDIFRLNDIASERINDALRRQLFVTLAGLAMIALTVGFASWVINHGVLAPIVSLQRATREIRAGNWNFRLNAGGDDEIGELSRNFDAMTRSVRESFARIEHSNQDLAAMNEELEAFCYSVSHDLRTPLRSMDGFSQVLLEDYGDRLDAEGRDALERIRAASQRMGDLIDDLLRLSRVARVGVRVTRVDLSAIAREIADAMGAENPGRSVEWAIEPGLSIHGDAALMKIALQNLIENAWKFTAKSARPVIRVGALEHESGSLFFVADNGVGFDMAHAGNLFGAFQRLHHADDFPGTGIGLAIVRRIIRRHEGEIRAESVQGAGATFFFSVKEPEHGPDEQDHPAG